MTDLLPTRPPDGIDPTDRDDLVAVAAVLPCYLDGRVGRDEAIAAWLAREDPHRSRLAGLLHTEIDHDGACYGRQLLWAGLLGLPLAIGSDLVVAVSRVSDGGTFEVLPFGPLWTTVAALGVVGLVMLVALVWHGLWHREEAPFVGNEMLDSTHPAWWWGGRR